MSRLVYYGQVSRRVADGLWPGPAEAAAEEALLGRHGRTFAFAARWLPAAQRRAVVVLYAFCRTLDDLVDEPPSGVDRTMVAAELSAWRAWLLAGRARPAPREPLGASLATVIRQYAIPPHCLLDLLDGLLSDLAPPAVADYPHLRQYCYRVAGTVGLALAHILGATTPAALAAAEELGVAMQLTNILRDVGADLAAGRLYLPADELARAGSSRAHLTALLRGNRGPDDRFRALMRGQIARAHATYEAGLAGIPLLPPESRLPILIAGRLYRRILTAIERLDYDVLRHRASTSHWEKLREACIAIAQAERFDGRGDGRSQPRRGALAERDGR